MCCICYVFVQCGIPSFVAETVLIKQPRNKETVQERGFVVFFNELKSALLKHDLTVFVPAPWCTLIILVRLT